MYVNNKIQLFLLHFAGGSCYSYDFLKPYLKDDFEFHALELPGRGKRHEEKLLFEKKETIEDYFDQIKKLRNDLPYLIFGHSMGATLGLSVTKKMEDINDAPEMLIVSGNAGPGINREKSKRYLLGDLEFKKELRKLGGIPDEVLENEELYDFFGPIMRADFEVLEKDTFLEKFLVLKTSIYAIMGDKEETVDQIENWSHFTTKDFRYEILSGNHFFIHNHIKHLVDVLKTCSSQVLLN